MSPQAEAFLSQNSSLIREAFLDMERELAATRATQPDCPECDGDGGTMTGKAWPHDWNDCPHCEGRGFLINERTL